MQKQRIGTYQVFIIIKCPTRTCVHARAPPSGGGPGSFQLATLCDFESIPHFFSLMVSLLIVFSSNSVIASGYASTLLLSVMLVVLVSGTGGLVIRIVWVR